MAEMIWANAQGRRVDNVSIHAFAMDPSEIRERLARSGRTQAELARHLRLDASSMSKTLKGLRRLQAKEMLQAEQFFANAETSETAGAPHSKQNRVPLYGYAASTGEDRVVVSERAVVEWIEPPPGAPSDAPLMAVRVVGDTMEPRLFEGEIVIAHLNLPPVRGADCLVEFKDGTAIVKTYRQRRDGVITVEQYNPPQQLNFHSGDVRAVHAVNWRRAP